MNDPHDLITRLLAAIKHEQENPTRVPDRSELPSWWDEAIDAHFTHAGCSFGGGMARSNWYWLSDPNCQLSHSDRCLVCDVEARHTLRWWSGSFPTDSQYPTQEMWDLPLCDVHVSDVPPEHVFTMAEDDTDEDEPEEEARCTADG